MHSARFIFAATIAVSAVTVSSAEVRASDYGARSWSGYYASERSAGYYRPRTVYPYRYYPRPYRASYLGYPYAQTYPFSLYARGWPYARTYYPGAYGLSLGYGSLGYGGYPYLGGGPAYAPYGFGYGAYPYAYAEFAAQLDRAQAWSDDDWAAMGVQPADFPEESDCQDCLYW